ncbi:MAG: protein kinase [Thermoguttaceae bacterium]|nr:protein kinase [Thermoguttaceae bacterium]MDW8039168.1 protein kinase [Thermoguttaceae bacterium]
MAITTVEGFLEALEKSALLDQAQLAEARQIASQMEDAKALARALVQKGLLSRWQAAQLLAGRTTLFFLGKYKLIEMLGRGGMGGVFLAHHTMMNRRVALKVISKQIAQDPAALEQFLAEARAIAALDHPNIVRAYNVDCEDGRYYLVMEYVEGKDLQRLVEEEGPLDFQKVVDYIRQAAEGLAHAHQHNLIHCDIKPSNLLVTPEGVVKILDLGLARWAASAPEQKEKEKQKEKDTDPRLVGTVDYQAPELGLGEKVDARADIYSLGCTMFFLLTGKAPFGEGTLHERILKHQTQPPPDIAALRPGVPKDLVAICRKMMAKKPADRFQSAEEVSKLLARWRPPQPKLRKAIPLQETDSSKNELSKPALAKPTAAEEVSAAEGKSTAQPALTISQPSAKRGPMLAQMPPWVWIAGGAATVVLVGLAIVWLVLAVSSEPPQTSKTKRESKGLGPKVHQEESPPWLPLPVQTGSKEPSKTAPEQPSPNPEQPPATPPKPQPTPKDKPETSEQPKSQPVPGETPQPNLKPSEKPTEKPSEKPAEKPSEKPAEKPSEKPSEKPPSEPSKPTPEPKPQPLRGDFWDDKKNPKPIDLPQLDKAPSEPISQCLGKLNLDVEARWYLELVGGNLIFKGAQQFRMEQHRRDAGFVWDVILQKGGEEKGPSGAIPMAQFEYKPNTHEFWFRWLPGADPEWANLLRNCVLVVNYRAEPFPIFLRRPLLVPPIELQLLRPSGKASPIQIPYLPANPERLSWHFHQVILQEPPEWKNLKDYKDLEALKHKVVFEPKDPSAADPKKPFLLKILRIDRANNESPGIVVQLMVQGTGNRFRVESRLMMPKPQALRTKEPIDTAIRLHKMAEAGKKTLEEDLRKDPKQRMPEKERTALQQAINKHDEHAWLIKMQHILDGGITLHYRILYELGRYQVELAQSSTQVSAEKK